MPQRVVHKEKPFPKSPEPKIIISKENRTSNTMMFKTVTSKPYISRNGIY